MAEFSTKLTDDQPFDPFKWQLNEVIWASVKTPYREQWERWKLPANAHSSVADFFTSNWSRAALYMEQQSGEPELINETALHLGKLAAGLTCSLAQFITPRGAWRAPAVDLRSYQAKAVDKVLTAAESAPCIDPNNGVDAAKFEEALVEAHEAAGLSMAGSLDDTLYKMSAVLFPHAADTTRTWLDFVEEHDGQFAMSPGGTPRSSGEHIEELREASEHLFVK